MPNNDTFRGPAWAARAAFAGTLPDDARLSAPELAAALTAVGLPTSSETLGPLRSRGGGPQKRRQIRELRLGSEQGVARGRAQSNSAQHLRARRPARRPRRTERATG
jgi:hypothetical protein